MRAMLLFWVCLLGLHASDLTTRDGKVYKDFKILSHDAGFITIIYADGGGKIPLSNLPEALQIQYHYDPTKAAAFAKQADEQEHQSSLDAARAETEASIAKAKKDTASQNASLIIEQHKAESKKVIGEVDAVRDAGIFVHCTRLAPDLSPGEVSNVEAHGGFSDVYGEFLIVGTKKEYGIGDHLNIKGYADGISPEGYHIYHVVAEN